MSRFQEWVRESRTQQARAPQRYLASYPDLVIDDQSVLMSKEVFERIERNCGRYDGTLPTGEFLGKMFVRGNYLCWYGIAPGNPEAFMAINSRRILIV